MIKFSLFVVFSISAILPPCFADESNLESFSYPAHNCGKKYNSPKRPARLASDNDVKKYNSAIVEYNIEVANYNKEIKVYKFCINQYIKNGNFDIKVIREKLNIALKEARLKK